VLTAQKHEKPVKEFFIFKREAPGICPVWPMVNPALAMCAVFSMFYE